MTQSLTLAWTRNGETLSKTVGLTTEGEQNIDVTIPGATSNVLVNATITVAQLALIYIQSSETITIKTNSSGSPAETITITKDKPFLWYTGCGWVNPFATNITALYLTRATTGSAVVSIRTGYDATP